MAMAKGGKKALAERALAVDAPAPTSRTAETPGLLPHRAIPLLRKGGVFKVKERHRPQQVTRACVSGAAPIAREVLGSSPGSASRP
ncbi:MAG: hypothetical protein R3B70_13035 [Polyangiaceae bacterium]